MTSVRTHSGSIQQRPRTVGGYSLQTQVDRGNERLSRSPYASKRPETRGRSPTRDAQYDVGRFTMRRERSISPVKSANERSRKLPLHDAVLRKDKRAVNVVLNKGYNVNAEDKFGNTALNAAASTGDVELAAVLVSKGASSKKANIAGWTPLHTACYEDKAEFVRFLLSETDADVDQQNADGLTSICLASAHGRDDILDILLSAKADVNIPTLTGETCLHLAAESGHTYEIRQLLDAGAESTATSEEDGYTCLHLAAMNGHLDSVKLLLGSGVSPAIGDKRGASALHLASEGGFTDVVKALIKSGVDINLQTMPPAKETPTKGNDKIKRSSQQGSALSSRSRGRGNSASSASQSRVKFADDNAELINADGQCCSLFLASYNGHVDTIEALLEAGANPDVATSRKCSSLYIACQTGNTDIARILVEKGASVNFETDTKITPLQMASSKGYKQIVELLLKAGANVNHVDGSGATALKDAVEFGHTGVVEALLKAGGDANILFEGYSPLAYASTLGNVDTMTILLANGSDVNQQMTEGVTSLHIAAANGQSEAVDVLLKSNADVKILRESGRSALLDASEAGYGEIISQLINAGTDVNSKCEQEPENGVSALFLAVLNNHGDLVKLLIDSGADVNVTNAIGWTALHVAAEHGHVIPAKILIDANINVNAGDIDNDSALHVAVVNNQVTVAELLLKYGAKSDVKDNHGKDARTLAKSPQMKKVLQSFQQTRQRSSQSRK